MYKIYKITCLITNKVYIGKTTKNNIKERWYEHVTNALTKNLQTHLCNAIRLYGDNQFLIEAIDYANNEEELNKKEKYWIKYYNSVLEGYNETEGGEGGNTYQYKTEEEMKVIKDKIRQSKLKGLNPHARKVKCKNVNTNEEYHFNSVAEMKEFFNHENHSFITKRCTNETKCLWQNEWAIAYEENDYNTSSTNYKNNARSKRIQIVDLIDNKSYEFPSFAAGARYFGLQPKTFSGKAYLHKDEPYIVKNRFKIIVLN